MVRKSISKLVDETFGGKPYSLDETHTLLNSIVDETTRFYAILSYLYAARVSEIGQYTYQRQIKHKQEGKTWKEDNPKYKKLVETGEPITLAGIKKRNFSIETNEKGKSFLVLSLRNEKHRTRHSKRIPAPIDREMIIVKPLLDWLNKFQPDDEIIPYSRITLWRKLKKYAPEFHFPHFLRALRLSHLVAYYKWNENLLVQFAGWSNSDQARWYIMLTAQNMMENM